MQIGFDLDNIFINTPPIIPHRVIERLYRGKTNGALKYRYPSRVEQLVRIISHAPFFRPTVKRNLSFVKSLSSDADHDLYLISSRFAFLKKNTEVIVRKHKLEKIFHRLYFNYDNLQPHLFKLETIKNLKLDKFVDDDLHLLKYIASRNNHVKLYWLNKKINKKISNNIQGITSLKEMLIR